MGDRSCRQTRRGYLQYFFIQKVLLALVRFDSAQRGKWVLREGEDMRESNLRRPHRGLRPPYVGCAPPQRQRSTPYLQYLKSNIIHDFQNIKTICLLVFVSVVLHTLDPKCLLLFFNSILLYSRNTGCMCGKQERLQPFFFNKRVI